MLDLVSIGAIVFFGATLQRVSGLGLGLVAGPVLAVILGPIEGIFVVNVISTVNALLNTLSTRSAVDWKKTKLIGGVLIFGSIPAAVLLNLVPVAAILSLVGVLLIIALGVVTFAQDKVPQVTGRLPAVLAGVGAGFMNTLTGAAGPVLTVYGQASRWEQRSFSASLQPLFLIAGAISVAVKIVLGTATLSHTSIWVWPLSAVAMILGIFMGSWLSKHISKAVARKFALLVALAGSISVLYKGITGLMS
ncbi:sulfite exporter TauE/SafE family protein [Corynebacterium crudilactis]|uniref:Probable membrane transporter protein n=1 Tax=Corynebacterium crudilactis TaxID=1652495 RepID=A0A172QT66_9CORY|nr:sulfite exporter TauE/SafE family protein [Corynebacterium crudilactis]ANE03895.1 permease [Corynebacterium crudilactis]